MKQTHYRNKTLSLVDEDWEATGASEMNELYEKCSSLSKVVQAQDALVELKELITVCIETLNHSELKDVKTIVASVLYFHVNPKIETIKKELVKTC